MDAQRFALEIDILPAQAAHFLAAQAEIARQIDDRLQTGALDGIQQPEQGFDIVIMRLRALELGRLYTVGRVAGEHILHDRDPQRIAQQVVVLARRVGGQAAVVAQVGIILLDALQGQRLQRDIPKLWNDVVYDHLAVPVDRCRGAVGTHDGIHPVVQPLGDCGIIRLGERAEVALYLVQPQRPAGIRQAGKGAGLFDLASVRVAPEIQIDIVFLFLVVIRDVALDARAGHLCSPSFL